MLRSFGKKERMQTTQLQHFFPNTRPTKSALDAY